MTVQTDRALEDRVACELGNSTSDILKYCLRIFGESGEAAWRLKPVDVLRDRIDRDEVNPHEYRWHNLLSKHHDPVSLAGTLLYQVPHLTLLRAAVRNTRRVTGQTLVEIRRHAASLKLTELLARFSSQMWTDTSQWPVIRREGSTYLIHAKCPPSDLLDEIASVVNDPSTVAQIRAARRQCLDGGQTSSEAALPETAIQPIPTPAVTIPDKDAGYVVALGHVVQMPSVEMEELMSTMLARFPGGLTLDEVRKIHKSGHSRLAQMAKQNPWFAAAVCRPGRRGQGGYRIRSITEAESVLAQTVSTPLAQIPKFKAIV